MSFDKKRPNVKPIAILEILPKSVCQNPKPNQLPNLGKVDQFLEGSVEETISRISISRTEGFPKWICLRRLLILHLQEVRREVMSLATRYRDDQVLQVDHVLFQNLVVLVEIEAEKNKTFPNSNSISVDCLGFEFCVFLAVKK